MENTQCIATPNLCDQSNNADWENVESNSASVQNAPPNYCNQSSNADWENAVINTAVQIPVTTNKNVALTGMLDDCQVYVIDTDVIVMIKKVYFKDKQKFISGCSMCYNLNTDFLVFLQDSQSHDSKLFTNLCKCKHIIIALSEILSSFECWQSSVTEIDLQSFLAQHLIWESSTTFFVSEKKSMFCGLLSPNDGLLLFVLKKGKWRCVVDKYQVATKCRHGQLLDLPEKYDEENDDCFLEPEPKNITMSSQLLTSKRFTGKNILFLNYLYVLSC